MKLRFILTAATCLALPAAALPGAAHAQPVTGPYVSLEGGVDFLMPVTFHESLHNTGGKMQYRPGYAGVASLGYGLGDGWRAQISMDDLHTTLHEIDDSAYGHIRASGVHTTWGPMLDVLYDMNVGLPIFPYVGAGAGYQWVQNENNGPFFASGTKGGFAYNLIAGLSYPIAPVPGLSLTAEYRFTQMIADTKEGESITGGFPAGSPIPGTVKYGHQSTNSILVGLRYQLFTPPAPAPAVAPAAAPVAAAPAPAPARTYLVFFDWDKATLTPRATQIIAQAASDSKTQATTTIDVNGYTDTSGTPVYNQGLSVRRAKAVAAQLVTDGVPASEITAKGFGDTNLLVPTGPGVREPQNRRVEIILN
ncbi:membrane protein [Acidocella aquatica]|uniref:Membrane protein n=1 Tax=Acidocella aquatica TaxID=1922313 RepID=A0ABQ6AC75_9PROT|nr:OmpA family protein [Acidocella aquatica]GLR68923.1 membrane protein [Acidocella aquatica]